jgi:hypothetical protein
MKYPEEVVTVSKSGKREARILIDRGVFVRYSYRDVRSGKMERKVKLVLIENGKVKEEYFLFPLKEEGKFLMVRAENKGNRKVYDEVNKEVVDLVEG